MGAQKVREPGTGLALAGGGFRATLFHLGSLWRLNELRLLKPLSEITGVSGGSIVAAYLGLKWEKLDFDDRGVATNYVEEIVNPLRRFCSRTVDIPAIGLGILLPLVHPSDILANIYRKHLFGKATLQNLPADNNGPRFTLYATNLQTGVSFRMSKPYMADYRVGQYMLPLISLAKAVAASSAFPPPLCPVKLKLDPDRWSKPGGADLYDEMDYRSRVYLGDGGIYDNMGLERIWDRYETVLVSDAGAPFKLMPRPKLLVFSQVARSKRALDIIGEQTRALRKRRLMQYYINDKVKGAYWGIASEVDRYGLAGYTNVPTMVSDSAATRELSTMRTRLNRFTQEEQGKLINWGYAICDTALRRWVLEPNKPRGEWPVPEYALAD